MSERLVFVFLLLVAAYTAVYFVIDESFGLAGVFVALTVVSFWTAQAVWADATTGDQFESE